ncbi:MAG: hypothetical protein K0Q79_42 [Flavipsychrobacter sp.]|nr:hypothetical protein [Flavipsychrobacter sp.]
MLVALLSTQCSAQGFYFRAGMGYAVPQAGQTLDGAGTLYNGSLNYATQSYSMKKASFSAGVHGHAAFGYMAGKNVGMELAADIGLLCKKYEAQISNVTLQGVPYNIRITQQAMPVIINPTIVVQNGGEKWNIYSRLGLAIPLFTDIVRDEIFTNVPGSGAATTEDYTIQMKNSFSLGFTGAAGVEYRLSSRMSLWAEISILSMSVYIKEAELTAITRNGQSYQVPANQVIKYTRSGVIDTTGNTQQAYSQPFSNFGFNVGIKINMSKRSRGTHPGGPGTRSRRPAPARFQ